MTIWTHDDDMRAINAVVDRTVCVGDGTDAQRITSAVRHGLVPRLEAFKLEHRFQGIRHYRCADGSRLAVRHSTGDMWAMPDDR